MKGISYAGKKVKTPIKDQLCLCKCPNWCSEGIQVARYDGSEFDYEDSPNHMFDDNVIGWLPLDENGIPMSWEEYEKK